MYKILSKQNFSVALTLILTILLSQSNIMNLFFDTILGRTVVVLFLLCISYTNHILGIASTLLVLLVFACSYNYTNTVLKNDQKNVQKNDQKNDQKKVQKNDQPVTSAPIVAVAPAATPKHYEKDTLDNKYINTEGFDILGTERNLQRGKKSNSIMVNEDMRKSEHVDAYDGWNNQSYFTSIS